MTKMWSFFREAGQVVLVTAVMLAALVAIIEPTAPTLLGVVLLGTIAVWVRGPLFIEEALWRARMRHRFFELDRCPWLDKIDEDAHGVLYRSARVWPWWEEAVALVEVCNHTPEPDGTFRTFMLRVPPTLTTARAGVAWTFGLDEDRYRPEDEA